MFTTFKKKSLLIIFVTMVNYAFASGWVDLGTPDPSEPSWEVNAISSTNLEISYKFKSSIIELSIEPIFTSIMNSILESFIQEAFKLKYDN